MALPMPRMPGGIRRALGCVSTSATLPQHGGRHRCRQGVTPRRSAPLARRSRRLSDVIMRHDMGRLCQNTEKVDHLDVREATL
jgi:hypothetical protein